MERAADFHQADGPSEKRDKLAALLSTDALAPEDIAPLFAQLLSIPSEGRDLRLALSPAQQRRKTLAALLDRVESIARRSPLLVVFEDCQWADASSLEMLDLLADRIRSLPMLLLITSRPGFEPAWGGLEHVLEIALDRMADADSRALVENLSPARSLPPAVVDEIIARTDGVPLFLEELTEAQIMAIDKQAQILNCGICAFDFEPNEQSLCVPTLALWNVGAPMEAEGTPQTAEPDMMTGSR